MFFSSLDWKGIINQLMHSIIFHSLQSWTVRSWKLKSTKLKWYCSCVDWQFGPTFACFMNNTLIIMTKAFDCVKEILYCIMQWFMCVSVCLCTCMHVRVWLVQSEYFLKVFTTSRCYIIINTIKVYKWQQQLTAASVQWLGTTLSVTVSSHRKLPPLYKL